MICPRTPSGVGPGRNPPVFLKAGDFSRGKFHGRKVGEFPFGPKGPRFPWFHGRRLWGACGLLFWAPTQKRWGNPPTGRGRMRPGLFLLAGCAPLVGKPKLAQSDAGGCITKGVRESERVGSPKAADATPADKYTYKPTPTVRSSGSSSRTSPMATRISAGRRQGRRSSGPTRSRKGRLTRPLWLRR